MGKSSLPPERSDTPGTHPSSQVGLSLPPDAQHRGVLKSRSSNRGGLGFHPCSLFCSHETFFLTPLSCRELLVS